MSRTICMLPVVVSTACGGGCRQPPSISDEIKDACRHYCDAVVKRGGAQAGALVAPTSPAPTGTSRKRPLREKIWQPLQ